MPHMLFSYIEPNLSVIYVPPCSSSGTLFCSVLYILLGVNVSQVLIGYVNTTSTQVFVYAEGHSNGTVFPGECTVCFLLCLFVNST